MPEHPLPQHRGGNGHEYATKEWAHLAIRAEVGPILARLRGMDKAIRNERQTLTLRLEHANGSLKQLSEDRDTLARKEALEEVARRLLEGQSQLARRVENLERYRSAHEGDTLGARRGHQPMQAVALLLVGAVIAAVVAFVAAKLAV